MQVPKSLKAILDLAPAGSNGTAAVAWTNTPNVAVSLAAKDRPSICAVAGPQHTPVCGSVSHTRAVAPAGASTSTTPAQLDEIGCWLAPMFIAATAYTPAAPTPGMFTTPSFAGVAATAMTSGVGSRLVVSHRVFTPVTTSAGPAFVQPKVHSSTLAFVGVDCALGVAAMMNVCSPSGGMSTGVFAVPTRAFVFGSVVWYANVAGSCVAGAMLQPLAVAVPALMMPANAVAGWPTWTLRDDGSTAAASWA